MTGSRPFLLACFAVTALILTMVPAINMRTDYSRVLSRDYENIYTTNFENLGYLKFHYLLEHRDDYDNLIFGSSRVRYGFDHAQLDSILGGRWYKMEYPGGSQYQHYEYLRRLIRKGFVPGRVILTIDDFDLWKRSFEAHAVKEYNRRLPPIGSWEAARFYWFYLYKNPGEIELDILRGELALQTSDRVLEDRGKSIPAAEDSVAHARKLATLRKLQDVSAHEVYHFQESLGYLQRFVELCEEHDIQVDIAFLPNAPETIVQRNHDGFEAFKTKLAAIHEFHDFSGIFPITRNPSNWADLSHFRTSVGGVILDILADPSRRQGEFGYLVNEANVHAHLGRVLQSIRTNLPSLRRRYGKLGLSEDLRRKLGVKRKFD